VLYLGRFIFGLIIGLTIGFVISLFNGFSNTFIIIFGVILGILFLFDIFPPDEKLAKYLDWFKWM